MVKVMIAEDNLVLADILEEIIAKAGYLVCGIARTVEEGIDLGLSQKPDLAILDLGLADGRPGTEIAARLTSPGRLGVLYSTGNLVRLRLTAADGQGCLSKPYSIPALLRGLEIVGDIVAGRIVTPPFPHGFRVLPPSPVLNLDRSFRL